MSKQQLAAILEMSAQNPIPANATPAAMRAWVEDVAGHLPVAENIQIERVSCGPCFRMRRHSRTARSEAGEL
jgi:epsilon-lactone hydrolase